MRRRFFVDQFEQQSASLGGEGAHHLGKVLRAQPGQLYELSDGSAVWLGRVEKVGRDAVEFALVEQIPARVPHMSITLLLSIVKFDRFEWSLEKATELGVAEIFPLAAERSEKGLVAAAGKRAARWRKILLESAQQSRSLRVPVLGELLIPSSAFTQKRAQDAVPLLLSEREDALSLKSAIDGKGRSSVLLAIGPEGGWTDGELAAARAAGFVEASLGSQILRTETAVVAALAVVNYALGE